MIKKLVSGRTYKRVISTLLAVAMSFSTLSVGSFSVDDPIPSDETEVISTADYASDTTENSTQETDTTESDTSIVSETTETDDNSETEPAEPTPEPAYVSPITVEIISETDTAVTISGYNLPDAVSYKIISNGMIIAETFSIENYTLTGLTPGSYFEFIIEAYSIDGSLIGQSEPIFGYTDLTVSSNYTLYDDMVVADFTVNCGSSGVFNLNGYSLTVMKNAIINSGTLDINSGAIYINGNASFGYTSNNSYVYLDMTNANDYILVKGDFYFRSYYSQSGYLTAGTLEVKGDFTQRSSSNNAGFYASGTHTTILTGEGLQKINFDSTSARFNTLEIRNFSVEGVVLETTVTRSSMITNGCNVVVYNGERRGWTLTADEVIDGDVYLTSGVLDLNGYSLTINGNLYLETTVTLSGDMDIKGNLYLQYGTLTINGHKLTVDGDFYHGTSDLSSFGYFKMTNESDYVLVGGDFYAHVYYGNSWKTTAGTLEIKGNVTQKSDSRNNNSRSGFYANGTHKTILSGDTLQTVSFESIDSRFNTIQISNTSEDGVVFATTITQNELIIDKGSKITFPDGELSGWTLSADEIIYGDVYLTSGTFNLNGFTLTINGNLTQARGTVYVNGGELIVSGDYRIQSLTNDTYANSSGILNMTNDSDLVTVRGSFIMQSTVDHSYYLTGGTLEVGGDLRQINGTDYNFHTSGAHTTILSGDSLQTVSFESIRSQFNIIQISNTSESGVLFATTIIQNELIIDEGSKLVFPDDEGYGWTLAADETIDGDLNLNSGILDLNGYTLTINGNLTQSGGIVNVNGGSLIIEGDYRIQSYTNDAYDISYGIFKMINPKDYVAVSGSFIMQSVEDHWDDLTAGTLEVGGDFKQLVTPYFCASGEHTLILNGNSVQNVDFSYSSPSNGYINNLKIENTSEAGVTFLATVYVLGELYDTESTIINPLNIHVTENTIFPDGSWSNDLNVFGSSTDIRLYSNLTVSGDLYLERRVTLYADLHVTGDLNITNGTITVNGQRLIVDGNINNVYIQMTNENDYVLVGGDFNVSAGYYRAGTLELKGDFIDNLTDNYGGFYTSGTHKTILSGDSLQTVTFNNKSQFNILEIANYSEEGVVFATSVNRVNLIVNDGCKLTLPDGERSGWTLTADETIDNDVYLTLGTLDLNGFTLTINGNLTQGDATVYVNKGNLIVNGDYRIQIFRNNAYGNSVGILNMTNASDIVSVSGSFITQSTVDHRNYLTAGTLEVGGDLRQIYGNDYNFHTSGDHTLVLNGDGTQEISISNDSVPYSRINNLKIENTSTDGVSFAKAVYVLGELHDTETPITNASFIRAYQGTTFPDGSWSNDLSVYGNSSLYNDLTVSGDLYLNSSLTLYADLNVTGDLYLQNGTLTINGHKLTVDGDFQIGTTSSVSYGYFRMTNADDYVLVGGSYYIYSYYGNLGNMTAGTLEIKGNVTQKYYSSNINSQYGFYASGTHRTILSGDSLQTVNFEREQSQFNILELTKDFDLYYEFSNKPMWNTLEQSGGDTTAPSKPTNLVFVSSSEISLLLSWRASTDNVLVAGYKIYRDGVFIGQTTETEYTDNNLTAGETYGYYVSAFDYSGNESRYSNAISASTGTDAYAPSKPANLSVSSQTANTVSLSWVSSTDNVSVDGYNIYRDDKLIGSVRNKTTFTDQNAPGGLYTYFIRAFDNEGNLSIPSETVKTDNSAPSKPVITVWKITESAITLSWTSVDNSENLTYDLYKNGTRIKTQIADSTYLDLQVSLSNEYTYYVVAYDAYKNASEKSEIVTVSTGEDEAKPTVSNVTINNGNKIAVVTVSASDNRAIASVTVEYSANKINWTATDSSTTDKTTTVKKAIAVNYSEFTDGVYYFRATATDVSGNISDVFESPIIEFTVDNTAPHTPYELTSDVTNGSIYIAWHYDTTDTDIAYFRVFRMKDDNGEFELIKDNYKYTSIFDYDFEVGYEYGYRITAVDKSGNESSYSATKRATVENDEVVPSVLSIYPTTNTKISNDFEMSVACFDNIKLKTLTVSVKRTDSETWQTLSTTELDTYHKVSDIEIDTSDFTTGQYEFKAIVTDAYGNESTAKSVVYSYKTNTLSAPVLMATGAGWRAELSWTMTNTEDIAGYYIYKRALTENTFKQIAGVTGTSFIDKNVNAGEKYFYRIEAIDTYGNSTVSEDISVVPTHEDEIKPMANAGSDLLAIAGESVSFDGSKSRDNNYVETYLWDFGDGATASSATTSHTYANEGKYTATLTVTDSSGNTASDTVSVTVLGSDNDRFIVKTTDENGVKLPDVNIICDEIFGDGESRSTDSNGEYIIIAPEGEYTLYLYADGYLPIKQTVKSTGTTTISLTKKDVAEGKLTVRELDYNEIVALGINLEAPENRQVFEYNVEVEHLEGSNCFKSRQFRNAEGALITDNSESGFRDEYNLNGIKLWEYDNNELIYSRSNGSSSGGFGNGGLKDLKLVAAMSITTDLTWLKEFYSVDLTIWNNASEDFFIDNALARITLPEGLSLADTDGLSKEIGKIEGGETKVISWIVRGDKSGSYNIAANFTGSLEPIGVPIEIDFETENPLVVEAGNALKLEVVHDLWSPSNDVWTIDYKLTNVSEKPVYDIQFEIITQYAIKCGMSIKEIDIYYIDREGYDNIHWTDGKPDFERTERFFDPLIENIPDKTISLYPGEYLEFTVYVTKE